MRRSLLLLLLCLFPAFAKGPVVRYAALGGVDFVYSRGDFDGKQRIVASGDSVIPENISLADVSPFVTYAIDLRAYVDASSVSFNLGLGYPQASYRDIDEEARFFRLGVEYQYHFFWPETIRPGIGLGYDFISLRVPHAAESEYGSSFANHSGNGFHLTTSLGYYGWEHLAFEAAVRYRLAALGNVSTDANDFSKLDHILWQGFGELDLRTIVLF